MKKRFLLLLSIALMTAVSSSAQRITSFSLAGVPSCGPSSAFNPTNNSETAVGDLQIVFPAGTDLSNATPMFDCGTTASVTTTPVPTNFTSPVRVKVEMTDLSSWALYDITCKVIKPATLPFTVFDGTTNSDSWTTSTLGWAAARIDKNQTTARFGGAKANLIVAFSDQPKSVSYSINIAAQTYDAGNVFDVEESANGVDWTNLVTFDADNPMPVSTSSAEEMVKTHNLKPTTRYLRWFYNVRIASNVTLKNITVSASDIVVPPELQNCRISTFDLKDAGGNSVILGYNAANATGAWDTGTAAPAVLDFIYLKGTDLSNVNLVTTIQNTAFIMNKPTDFSAPLQLKTQNGTISPYSYALYNVTPRQLTPIELPATFDLATPFSPDTEGWAAARLIQSSPGGVPSISLPAVGTFALLAFINAPGVLSFKIATNTGNTGNTFDVYESVDGITWNASPTATYSGANVPEVGNTDPAFSVCLNSTTRFVKMVLSARSGGNFYISDISATAFGTGISNPFGNATKVFAQSGLLNIISNEAIVDLEIFALSGQLVAKVSNPSGQVNIANLPAGCYIVKLKNADGQTTVNRFVK